jgi:hypothetical protein
MLSATPIANPTASAWWSVAAALQPTTAAITTQSLSPTSHRATSTLPASVEHALGLSGQPHVSTQGPRGGISVILGRAMSENLDLLRSIDAEARGEFRWVCANRDRAPADLGLEE